MKNNTMTLVFRNDSIAPKKEYRNSKGEKVTEFTYIDDFIYKEIPNCVEQFESATGCKSETIILREDIYDLVKKYINVYMNDDYEISEEQKSILLADYRSNKIHGIEVESSKKLKSTRLQIKNSSIDRFLNLR